MATCISGSGDSLKDLNLIVCSDLHGSSQALDMLVEAASSDSYDAMVVCGDFTTFGTTEFTEKFLKRLKLRIFAVPGNCDLPETVSVLEAANASIHNVREGFMGRQFFGSGGALPGGGTPFEIEDDILERSLRSVAVKEGIMVTHCPAYGMNDLTKNGRHLGSNGVLRVANEFKPILALSGHVHEAQGRIVSKDTVFVNPGTARHGSYATVRVGDSVDVEFHEVQLQR
jgi:Icc-related predicted phosphoesterase